MLKRETSEAVLDRLGFSASPDASAAGLADLYAAWCRDVHFDNLVKRIHLAAGNPEPIPNGPPEAFFASFLRHGTGGTCWPSSGALHALLQSVGFDARRGSASMYDDRFGAVHSHGTVLVRIGEHDHWVDSSMLTQVVLPLRPGADTQIPRTFDTVRAEPVDDLWRVWWESSVNGEPIGCLLLDDDVTEEHYLARYEASREVGPFNHALSSTRVEGDHKVTISAGQRFERDAEGITHRELGDDRTKILVEEFGYSEEIVAALPSDDEPPVPS